MDAIRNAFVLVALGVLGAQAALGAQVTAGVSSSTGSLCYELNSTGALLTVSCSGGAFGGSGIDARLEIAGQTIRHAQVDAEFAQAQVGIPTVHTTSSTGVINNVAVANALGTYQHSVPITLGQEFFLQMSLSVQASGTVAGEGAATASINAMNSFDWGGIQSLTVDGQSVEFSVTSQSGTDWTQAYTSPVPEVPTMALLLTGLGIVLRRAVKAGHSNAVR